MAPPSKDAKRKAAEDGGSAAPSKKASKPASAGIPTVNAAATTTAAGACLVNPKRVRPLTPAATTMRPGPVIYWMSRDQRVEDNWALIYALEQAAASNSPVAVAFNLVCCGGLRLGLGRCYTIVLLNRPCRTFGCVLPNGVHV